MATSNSNITAVHFSLIFFVMLSIILGVVSYLKINESTVAVKDKNEASKEAADSKKRNDTTSDVTSRILTQIGYASSTTYDEQFQNRMITDIQADHKKVIDLYTQHDWNNELGLNKPGNLRQDLMLLKVAYDRMREDKERSLKELTALKEAAEAARVQAETSRDQLQVKLTAETTRVLEIEKKAKEAIDAKDKKIRELDGIKQNLLARLDAEREAHANQVVVFEKRISGLVDTVQRKQQIIDEIKQVSFERPDGVIRKVDYRTKLVWIDLGSADRLPKRMTFSVYSASHHGVGRGREDIKGSIEITRITGQHIAEARILNHDIYDPIRAGDPIYTPLWSAGTKESFAFVGFFDLDDDGQSDRDVLYRKVRAARAVISNSVDDMGVRTGAGLTTEDKFLVRGIIKDPDTASTQKERDILKKISEENAKLETEAREKGIRIIRLADFLAYIGFKADRRLWRPGEGSPRKLKAGAASSSARQTIGNRASSGRTSGVYSRSSRLKQPKSTGQTSGGKGY